MFQYAAAKALSLKYQQLLLIDNSFLLKHQLETSEFTPRCYELDVFQLSEQIAPEQLIRHFNNNSFYKKIQKLLKMPYKKCHVELADENVGQLDKIRFPVLLKGYWQSEQYFASYKTQIRDTFAFKIGPADLLAGLVEQLSKPNAVSVHFRRGDYLTNTLANKVLGTLPMDYYKKAIAIMRRELSNPFFYVFSDDTEWVKKIFPLDDNYQIMDHFSKELNHYDMLLMSKCAHHIIANSSYSWWGAWLNPQPRKLVIAPEQWFADERLNKNSTGIVPIGWTRI